MGGIVTMKKPSLIMVLMLGMALLLTACSGNMGTEASDSIADTGIINLNENPIENPGYHPNGRLFGI